VAPRTSHAAAVAGANVGSLTDIDARPADVRFTPRKWTLLSDSWMSALCQKRLMQRSKFQGRRRSGSPTPSEKTDCGDGSSEREALPVLSKTSCCAPPRRR
jgi:hypothetical protein